jgi:hypothetical protein
MRTGVLQLPTNKTAYATHVANAAEITSSIDDTLLGDGSQGSALDTGTIYTLNKTSTTPYGSTVLATQSGTGRWLANAVSFFSGPTAARPTAPYVGEQWFDTSVSRPTWWNGASWIEADGTVVP